MGARSIATVATTSAYVVLGITLVVTRAVGLNRSFWHDEIVTMREFILAGPREIVAGDLLNHELYSLLAWATSVAVGPDETAMRIWSVLPFILGVVVVVVWLHIRFGALSSIAFLFFATCSPLLLDVSRQARGYGIAFLAMAVMLIAALEAGTTRRSRVAIAVFCIAGVAGTFTLPNFAVVYLTTAAVLVLEKRLRRQVLSGIVASLIVLFVLYVPHLGAAREASREEYGVWIDAWGLVTAPIDQIVLPALLRLDGAPPVATLAWLPLVVLIAVPMASSPLLRSGRSALVVASGTFTTVVALWAVGTYVVPRYLSYLLVPLLVLLATGSASILTNMRGNRPGVRAFVVVLIVTITGAAFARVAVDVLSKPREAHRDAAATALAESVRGPTYAYMLEPGDLEYYLGERVRALAGPSHVSEAVCGQEQPVTLVAQPWRVAPLDPPCQGQGGVRRVRLEQYARGGHIDVWLVPPAS